MRNIIYALTTLIMLISCNNQTIDIEKRDRLVKKYDLLNFPNLPQPILLTIDEFFDGNNDVGSIATNLGRKPEISEYYKIFKELRNNPKVIEAFANISEVMIYEDGKLNDNEWLYCDKILIVGDITIEEVKEATRTLFPDEVEYDKGGLIKNVDEKFKDKNVIFVWWD